MIDANAAITALLEKRPEKIFKGFSLGYKCNALPTEPQSHMRALVCGLVLYVQWT